MCYLTSKYLTLEFDVRTNCLLKSTESVKYLIEKQWNSSSYLWLVNKKICSIGK